MSLRSILSIITLSVSLSAMAGPGDVPAVLKDGQLLVDGKPFTLLAGELHNSTTGSVQYMRDVWKQMAGKNLNTVIAAASWELVEPKEGQFNFRELDAMIDGAREAGLRLVVLWFGTWKNGDSSYVPAWVKLNQKRFPRAHFQDGQPTQALSPLGKESQKADARAFAALTGASADAEEVALTPVSGVLILQRSAEEFLILGGVGPAMLAVTSTSGKNAGILSVDEIRRDTDGSEYFHRLNGDETSMGITSFAPGEVKALRVRLYQY